MTKQVTINGIEFTATEIDTDNGNAVLLYAQFENYQNAVALSQVMVKNSLISEPARISYAPVEQYTCKNGEVKVTGGYYKFSALAQ